MTKTSTKTPTAAAIDTAIKNAAKMDAQGYTVHQSKRIATIFVVAKNDAANTLYVVDTTLGYVCCDCPQYQIEGVCKHQKYVADHIRLMEEEAAYEDYLNELAEGGEIVQAGVPNDLQAATWPRCEECGGLFDEAVCGLPLDLCDRCEKRAFI